MQKLAISFSKLSQITISSQTILPQYVFLYIFVSCSGLYFPYQKIFLPPLIHYVHFFFKSCLYICLKGITLRNEGLPLLQLYFKYPTTQTCVRVNNLAEWKLNHKKSMWETSSLHLILIISTAVKRCSYEHFIT